MKENMGSLFHRDGQSFVEEQRFTNVYKRRKPLSYVC